MRKYYSASDTLHNLVEMGTVQFAGTKTGKDARQAKMRDMPRSKKQQVHKSSEYTSRAHVLCRGAQRGVCGFIQGERRTLRSRLASNMRSAETESHKPFLRPLQ